ncbi:MAG TPA: TonB-dependent receptor [Vicinamibacterales bacterium]|nr:TonB-dependent receptor [Vicinamibacterales bacterium]
MFSIIRRSLVSVIAGIVFAGAAAAQEPRPVPPPAAPGAQPATITGQVRQSGSLKPIGKAAVLVEGTSLRTTSAADGRFSIEQVPAGAYHLIIAAAGMMPLRVEVTVGSVPSVVLEVLMDAEVHYTEVVSVSPDARDQFESYQPTSVLAGQELTKDLQGTLGATLERQTGVAERSFGPGPSRPVIRGLDGDRVLILKNGQRFGDLSSQSGDHGVPTNPASASRIEVVRGPATLLYGANAIGGLVNIIDQTIPTTPLQGVQGAFVAEAGTAASEAGTAADLRWGNGSWALNLGGSGRRNRDVDTPGGTIDNTQSRGAFGSVGAAWTGARGFFGASYGYDDTKYGIPVVEEGLIQLTPRRHTVGIKAGASQMRGLLEGFRADFTSTRYEHAELVGEEVGTQFENNTDELNLRLRHKPAGRLSGTLGGWFLTRDFTATGEEALSPPVKEKGAAAFLYEELTWPHATFQFGGRVNHASFDPAGDLVPRDFTDISGSVGVLLRPEAANDRLTIALSLARSARNPALEELYFFGPHPGNFAFEIGNSSLNSEKALGFDVALRWRGSRMSGEVAYFRNSIDDYVFRNPISLSEFVAEHGPEEAEDAEFPFVEFVAANSLLQGFEGHADVNLAKNLMLEVGLDYVRGELRDTGDPLPRIPPFRLRGGLTYHRNAFQVGGEVVSASKQDRVFGEETETPGYRRTRLFGSYSFGSGDVVNTITLRLDNATDELYRNHLSFIKDFVPEMGRNFKIVYALKF